MKSFWISFFGIIISAYLLSMIGGWWIVFVPCFIFGLLVNRKTNTAFWSGFWGIAVLWIVASLFWLSKDQVGYHGQVMQVFTDAIPTLASWSPKMVLLVLVGLIGGMTAGLCAWAGQSLRKIF